MPNTREEYEYHLRRIKEAGLRFVILWQVYEHDLSIEMLDYYSGLETSGFIVANDKNAALIKQYNPQLLVICSIVQRTCYNIPQIRNPTKVSERCGPNRQECDFSSLD